MVDHEISIVEAKLSDGSLLCSCHNSENVPYVMIENEAGGEEGSLPVTGGFTKGERCIQAMLNHYYIKARAENDENTLKMLNDLGLAIFNHFGERGLKDPAGNQYAAIYSPYNCPSYQDTENVIYKGKMYPYDRKNNVVNIGKKQETEEKHVTT